MTTSKLYFKSDEQLLNAVTVATLGKGQSFASLTATTSPKCTKKHRVSKDLFDTIFTGAVYKTTVTTCNINVKYENAVNNQLKREGMNQLTFAGETLPYGEWVDGLENIVIVHNESYQLRYFVGMNDNKPSVVYHYANGVELTEWEREQLNGFLPKKYAAKNQGTDKEIKPRNVKFASVVELN